MTETDGCCNMRITNLGYLIKEGLRGIFRHGFMSFAAVCVTVACLLIVGTFSSVMYNLNIIVSDLNKTNEVLAYVDENLTDAEARGTVSQLADPEGITSQSISDVEILDAEAGVVRFTLSEAFENSYKEQYEMSGISMTAFKGYCEATLADGILTEYRYHMEMTLRIEGETVKTVVDMTITFGAADQGAETV